jgi:hypothetical protein
MAEQSCFGTGHWRIVAFIFEEIFNLSHATHEISLKITCPCLNSYRVWCHWRQPLHFLAVKNIFGLSVM